jgi:hypothetical protein
MLGEVSGVVAILSPKLTELLHLFSVCGFPVRVPGLSVVGVVVIGVDGVVVVVVCVVCVDLVVLIGKFLFAQR